MLEKEVAFEGFFSTN